MDDIFANSWNFLDYLKYGALAISAFGLVLSFLLIWRGNRPSGQVFGFMFFSFSMLLLSSAAELYPQWLKARTPTPTPVLQSSPDASFERADSISIWESGWIAVENGNTYQLKHGLGKLPLHANIWYRAEGSDEMHLMDGIYSSGGYGTFLMDVDSDSLVLATGLNSSTSGYGGYNHWMAIDEKYNNRHGTTKRSVKVVLLTN